MVIGDDQIDAELARAAARVGAADAAIDGHDQRHAVRVQTLDRDRLQAVAVLQPLGDEVDHVGAEQLERAAQNHGRRHAVDVVVAMNGNPLFVRDRGEDAIDRDPHVGERHRIVQVVERRFQKSAREVRVCQAPLT